jgi:L-asparagine oxygenase
MRVQNTKYGFGQGDRLVVDLIVQQELNEIVQAYETKGYYISAFPQAGVPIGGADTNGRKVHTLNRRLLIDLETSGYLLVSGVKSEQLLDFVEPLGPVRIDPRDREPVRDLRPQSLHEATPNTLSSRYGIDSFPLHTDAAHWKEPARFLVLHCVHPGSGMRPTHVQDCLSWNWEQDDQRNASREVWKTGHLRPQLCTVGWYSGGRFRMRFDQACMSPLTTRAVLLGRRLTGYIKAARLVQIQWEAGLTLVIDNQRMLHCRGKAACPDSDRLLQRILIGERK